MSYVRNMLIPGENITLMAETSRIAYINAIGLLVIMMQPFNIMRLARTELALTDRRILGTTGVGGRKHIALKLAEVEGVSVRRGLLGWLLDYGSIIVRDRQGNSTVFKGIVLPLVFQQEAEEAIEVALLGHKLSDYAPSV